MDATFDRSMSLLCQRAERDDVVPAVPSLSSLPWIIRFAIDDVFAQIEAGELAALASIRRVLHEDPVPSSREFAQSQLRDEARHVEFFAAMRSQLRVHRKPMRELVAMFDEASSTSSLPGLLLANCAPASMNAVASGFVERFPAASFFYVTEEQRALIALPSYSAWPAGADLIIDLPSSDFSREVASAKRKAAKAGFVVLELRGAELLAAEPSMRSAQAAYLARREVQREMEFLTRPCLFAAELTARTFALELGGAFLGFVVLDPYFTADGSPGFMLNMFRIGPTKLWGVYQATVAALCEQLSSEGAAELSLGFVPLATTETSSDCPFWLRAQVSLMRAMAHRSRYLMGLGRMKGMFNARRKTRLLLSRRACVVKDVSALMHAMGARS